MLRKCAKLTYSNVEVEKFSGGEPRRSPLQRTGGQGKAGKGMGGEGHEWDPLSV
jgi:hypothetical protein